MAQNFAVAQLAGEVVGFARQIGLELGGRLAPLAVGLEVDGAAQRPLEALLFALPATIPAGRYTLAVGLYDPVSGQRLAVSAGPASFAIELGPVQVE